MVNARRVRSIQRGRTKPHSYLAPQQRLPLEASTPIWKLRLILRQARPIWNSKTGSPAGLFSGALTNPGPTTSMP